MKDKSDVVFVWKKTCDTCRKIKKVLDSWGVKYTSREINAEPLLASDIEMIIGRRPVKPFLNSRNQIYRELALSKQTPEHAEAVRLIAQTNNLLKRPVLIKGEARVLGNRLDEMAQLLGQARL